LWVNPGEDFSAASKSFFNDSIAPFAAAFDELPASFMIY